MPIIFLLARVPLFDLIYGLYITLLYLENSTTYNSRVGNSLTKKIPTHIVIIRLVASSAICDMICIRHDNTTVVLYDNEENESQI